MQREPCEQHIEDGWLKCLGDVPAGNVGNSTRAFDVSGFERKMYHSVVATVIDVVSVTLAFAHVYDCEQSVRRVSRRTDNIVGQR